LNIPAWETTFLMLPNGQVLFAQRYSSQLWVYTPGGSPKAAWRPKITSVAKNADGSYLLSGTQLNGISEGASFGDDAEMSTNYPIVRLKGSAGRVFYARSYDWSSTDVATGSTPETTDLQLPSNLPSGSYKLTVIANGISSRSVPFMFQSSSAHPALPKRHRFELRTAGIR
jgi:hypothetical protein